MPSTYDEVFDAFEWQDAWDAFDGSEDGQFNLGYEAVGKHRDSDSLAVRIVDLEHDTVEERSYRELYERASQFAHFLDDVGLERGDRVAALLPTQPELYAAFVGSCLAGKVYVPLYTLFGPEAVNYRLDDSDAKVVVTTTEHREKIDAAQHESLKEIVVIDGEDESTTTFDSLENYEATYDAAETHADDIGMLQYTSGTTGNPKGTKIMHKAPVSVYPYIKHSADMREGDNYFGLAPPAWSYGLIPSTASPLSLGIGLTTIRGQFEPEGFIDVLREYEITNLFATPTAYRQLRQVETDFSALDLDVRHAYSAGGPLDSTTTRWGEEAFGSPIQDNYGLTEIGMPINNYRFDDWEMKPGSMGKPMPGFTVDVLDLEQDKPVAQGETGEIAIHKDSPVWAVGYLGLPEASEEKFGGTWIRTDDLARIDEDGYYHYEGRADDVIISADYRIGPTEVEDSLMGHEAVAETAVVGLPDEERGEIVAAFVVLTDDADPTDELARDVQQHVRDRLSKHEYPKKIEFVNQLPKTETGKIQRYQIREDY